MSEIPQMQKLEDDKEIVESIQKGLDKQTAALCFIASYAPQKISPTKSIEPSIGLFDELAIEEAIAELKKHNIINLFLLVNSFGGGCFIFL